MTDNASNRSRLETLRERHGAYIPVIEAHCHTCVAEGGINRTCHYSPSGLVLLVCPCCKGERVVLVKVHSSPIPDTDGRV